MYDLYDTLVSFGPYRAAMIAYSMFFRLWYFLVIGITIGAAFNVFMPKGKVRWILRNSDSVRAICIAACLGALSPLGSYAVIPIFAALLGTGVSIAPVMTFLTASPLINPFIFYITYQFLGLKMAFARLFAALILGILTGFIFKFAERFGDFRATPATLALRNLGNESKFSQKEILNANSENSAAEVEKLAAMMERKSEGNKWKSFFICFLKMLRYCGTWFAFSIILASIVDVYVPADWIVRTMGGHSYSILLAIAMAIPFYVCGGGAVPMVWTLIVMGMSQGAAMAFFIVGPVTRIAPMITVIALLRYKAFAIYFSTSIVFALIVGFVYHLI